MECGDLKHIARVENLWMNSLEALCACWKRVITLGMARSLVCETSVATAEEALAMKVKEKDTMALADLQVQGQKEERNNMVLQAKSK
jgi:hypothetical protein